jgi:hypothetical protein
MAFFRQPFRIKRRADGFEVYVAPELRAGLVPLFAQLDQLLETSPDDPSLRRLQPPAYLEDEEREAAYRLLAGEELRTSRRAALRATIDGLEQKHATEEELWSWMQAINAVRLVLGTRLDVADDEEPVPLAPDDPLAPEQSAYLALTFLQYEIIKSLQG